VEGEDKGDQQLQPPKNGTLKNETTNVQARGKEGQKGENVSMGSIDSRKHWVRKGLNKKKRGTHHVTFRWGGGTTRRGPREKTLRFKGSFHDAYFGQGGLEKQTHRQRTESETKDRYEEVWCWGRKGA